MRSIDVSVGVAYGNAPNKVLELLLGVAASGLKEPKPVVFFIGFGDSAMNFELRTWTNHHWGTIRSELTVAVYEALRAAGIEIPFPQHEG